MIVAAIAWNKLNPEVKKEVARLLQQNPSYGQWTKNVSKENRDAIAFITAATWPDVIKDKHSGYDNSEGQHPKFGSQSGQNIGYADKLQHRYWHFYDKPFSPDHTKLGEPDSVNALTQIVAFTNAIKTSADDSIKSYDIVWLIHMVGDVHQPLHATSRFDEQDPQGDQGGNLVKLICTPPAQISPGGKCPTELHGFWDGVPGPDTGAASAQTQAATYDQPSAAAADSNPSDWIGESFAAAQKWVYVDPIGIGDGPFALTGPYVSRATTVAHERIALAGARLANLLNQNLKTPH